MNFNEVLKDLNNDLYIIEYIKEGNQVFKIKSHKLKKVMGKQTGYSNLKEAVSKLHSLKTKGDFDRLQNRDQHKIITNYIARYKL